MDPWGYPVYQSTIPTGSSTSPNPSSWGGSLSPLDSIVPAGSSGGGYFPMPIKSSVSPGDASTSPGSAFRSIYTNSAFGSDTSSPPPPLLTSKTEPIPTPARSSPISVVANGPADSSAATAPIVITQYNSLGVPTNPSAPFERRPSYTAAPPLQVPRTTQLGVPITRHSYFPGVYYHQPVSYVNMYGTNEFAGGNTPTNETGFSPLSHGPLGQGVYYVPDAALFKSSISPPVVNPLEGRTTPGTTPTTTQTGIGSPGATPTPPAGSSVGLGPSPLDGLGQPAIMYRNLFHAVECQLPLNETIENYNGWRVFIDDTVGYAGNAKIFKRLPDKDERALILTVKITDNHRNELFQCMTCREYFENRMYFKANPHIKGRIILVKNNNVVKLENGVFKINIKFMCCCKHQHVQHYILHLCVKDNISNNVVASAQFPIYVKQWRKSTQKKQSCTIMLS